MNSEKTRFCVVNFMDGRTLRFTFDAIRDEMDPTIGMAIEKLASSRSLYFDLEGKLMIIPMNNVRTIEVSPIPSKLPLNIIKGRLMD